MPYQLQREPIIRFEQVNKRFWLAQNPTNVVESLLSLVKHRPKVKPHALWAVQDVSFDVHKGESVGLVGHNGSGKSTLLKLATRILRPTSGRVEMNGRISALLELGAGFHNDLTGRENIYLNAAVLGLSKRDVIQRFDAIVAFSELEEFIDIPVKHYSSGMYMRLGFSVAVHCDPDILLVDEILAVGDQAFQRKCIERIYALKRDGVTIVMVSHHIETLQKLCDQLVWMDHGQVQRKGVTDEVVGYYLQRMSAKGERVAVFERNGTHEAEITQVRFLNQEGEPTTTFKTGDAMTMEMTYLAHRPIFGPDMGFAIFREDGIHINGTSNRLGGVIIDKIEGEGKLRYHINSLPLLPGSYLVSAAIQDGEQPHAYDFHVQAYRFLVEPGGSRELHGLIALPATWEWAPKI